MKFILFVRMCFFIAQIAACILISPIAGVNYGYSRGPAPTPAIRTGKTRPIEVPAIPLDEMKEITKNFSNDALIGEGSYARVFFGVQKDGQKSAVKKLDSSKQPDQEFLSQVQTSFLPSCRCLCPQQYCPSQFYFFCRFPPFQDSSMTMLSNLWDTVL